MSRGPTPSRRHRADAIPPAQPMHPGELRQDPMSGRWVAISAGRAARPEAFMHEQGPPRGPLGCPFCVGNEHMTPPEVWADREPGSAPDGPGWRVRVVPNKFPAFAGPDAPPGHGLYRAAPTAGGHEVVIHGTDHHATLADQPAGEVARVMAAWGLRLAAWRDADLGSVSVIVNQGRLAGASLEHPHSQVFATAARPVVVDAELARLSQPDCVACAMLNKERGGDRVVADGDGLLTLCPWASSLPFEALLLPSEHLPRFGDGSGAGEAATAAALGGLLRRLAGAAGPRTPYNLVLHTAPPGVGDFHWHLHLFPRLTTFGGFELASGIIINVVDPDHAAAALRAAG
ncbi:MAG TPA: galactose-1-phosphate uridylyltransferase [Actinomycetes bacterium]